MYYLLEGTTAIYKSDGRDEQQFSQAELRLLKRFDDLYFEHHTNRRKRIRGGHSEDFQAEVSEAVLCASPAPFFRLMRANKYITFAEKGIEVDSYPMSSYDLFYTPLMSSYSEKLLCAMIQELKLFLQNRLATEPQAFPQVAHDELLGLVFRRFLGKRIAELPSGSIFGERALEDDQQPRSASVVSMATCV